MVLRKLESTLTKLENFLQRLKRQEKEEKRGKGKGKMVLGGSEENGHNPSCWHYFPTPPRKAKISVRRRGKYTSMNWRPCKTGVLVNHSTWNIQKDGHCIARSNGLGIACLPGQGGVS